MQLTYSTKEDQFFLINTLRTISLAIRREKQETEDTQILMCEILSCSEGKRSFFALADKLLSLCQYENLLEEFNNFIKLFFKDPNFFQENQKDLMQVWLQSFIIEKLTDDFIQANKVTSKYITLSDQILWPIDKKFHQKAKDYFLQFYEVRNFYKIIPRLDKIINQLQEQPQFAKFSKEIEPHQLILQKKQSLKNMIVQMQCQQVIINEIEEQKQVKIVPQQDIYLQILNDILAIILGFNEQEDSNEIRDKIVDYLNYECSGGSKRIERNRQKKIFQEIFRVEVTGTFCRKTEISQPLIRNSIQKFKKYYNFYQTSYQFENERIDEQSYLDQIENILKKVPTALFWVNHQNRSILQTLIAKQINSKTIFSFYKLAFMEEQGKNLTSPILSSTSQPLLYALLNEQLISKQVVQFFFYEFLAQNPNFDDILKNKKIPYYQSFIKAGLKKSIIEDQINKKMQTYPQRENKFIILDEKTRQQIQVEISSQHQGRLISMFQDQNQHRNIDLSELEYVLKVTITNDVLMAQYQKDMNFYKGILIYKELPKQKITWALFDQNNFRQIILNPEESNEIDIKLKQDKQDERFVLNIMKLNKKIRINPNRMRYQQILKKNGDCLNSIIFTPGGLIFWYPTYKKKSLQRRTHQTQNYQDSSDDEIKSLFSLEQKQEIIQIEEIRFNHLGVFKDYFNPPPTPISKFTIIQPNNVVVCSISLVQYFLNFRSQQIDRKFQQCFSQKESGCLRFCLYQKTTKLVKLVEQKLNQLKLQKNSQFQFQIQDKILFIKNVIENDRQKQQFVEIYIMYLLDKSKEKSDKMRVRLTLNQTELKYIEMRDRIRQKIQIKKIQDSEDIQIITDQITFNQIKEEIMRNQVTFKLDQVPIVKEMLSQHPQFLKTFEIKIQFIDEEFFTIKCSLQNYQIFTDQLMMYKKESIKKQQKSKQTKIFKNESKYIQIYESFFQKFKNCQVYPVGKDIYIIYQKMDKQQISQQIQKAKKKIQAEEQKAKIKQLNKKYQFFLSGIDWDLACLIKQKLQRSQYQKFKNQQIRTYISFKKIKNQFVFVLSNSLPQNLKLFEQQINNLSKILQVVQKKQEQIHKKKKIVYILTEMFNEIINSKASRPFKIELDTIMKGYRKQLWKIYYNQQEISLKLINQQLYEYIESNNSYFIQKNFTFKKEFDIQNQVRRESHQIKPFQNYLERIIEKASNDDKQVKHPQNKIKRYSEYVRKLISPQFKNIDDLLMKNRFILQNFTKVAARLNILVATYFKLNLPIVDHLETFRQKIEKNKNLIVKTGTGSGKSSVLPAYLRGIGYQKVIVTQPRRLPCKEICKRIQKIFGKDIVGYVISGQQKNESNGLIYMTDGFFKEAIFNDTKQLNKIDAIIIDQIHERSKNIDLILLLLSDVIDLYPKLKIILCSATVDNTILDFFDQKHARDVFQVQINRKPVKVQKIQQEDMLEKINELSLNLKKDEQLLAFFPGVSDVLNAVQIFKQKKKKLVYPLYGFQKTQQQNQALQKGQILFATSIAETSLTFSNLKYVVDSRKSRIRKFDPKLQLMVTLEIQSSQSSKKQRQGRVGRTCPGQYYYIEYIRTGNQKNEPFQLTQLQKSDLSNAIFELILKYNDFQKAISLIQKLNNRKEKNFLQKIQFSKKKFSQFQILKDNFLSPNNSKNLIKFGNLGSYRNNYAMYKGQMNSCGTQMGALIAFLMYGSQISAQLLIQAKNRFKSQNYSDIQVIIRFLINLTFKISLINIDKNEIRRKVQVEDPSLKQKRIISQLVKILRQMKKIYKFIQVKNVVDWKKVLLILVKAHKDCIFFNFSLLGGNQRYYEKLIPQKTYFQYENKKNYEYTCTMDKRSLLSQKQKNQGKYQVILSYFPIINTNGQVLLFLNSYIPFEALKEEKDLILRIQIKCKKVQKKISGYNYIDEQNLFQNLGKGIFNNPMFSISGQASSLFPDIKQIMANRKGANFEFDMNKRLLQRIQRKKNQQALKPHLTEINSDYLIEAFSQLNDQYKNIFTSMKYDLQNNFGCKVYFGFDGKITLKQANNAAINHFYQKIDGFFFWFLNCQKIYIPEINASMKQPDKQQLGQTVAKEIFDRINQLVDPSIDEISIRSLGKKGKVVRSNRINRMIAVCWILINKFNCKIKGGFVRDWVVNGTDYIPPGTDLKNLLKPNPRNKFLQVVDDLITPSDIDVELPKGQSNYFDCQKFIKEIKKLGITVQIQDQPWRKHVLFDEHSETGGFTADLIQPFCHICHDTIDFDVNALYIKKGYLNQLGLKFPLKMTKKTNLGLQNVEVSLEQLIISCRKKEMRIIKSGIPAYRKQKFQKRKWKIDQTLYEPVIFNSKRTTLHPDDITSITKILPNFTVKMNGFTIVKVECIVNQLWTRGYEATIEWIVNQGAEPNQKYLYHGSKEVGVAGILKSGFDSRYYYSDINKQGGTGANFGRGAYFADDPLKSHSYTALQNGVRKMFVCAVALGKQQNLLRIDTKRLGPSRGYHSIFGNVNANQYIIERWGQAKPIYLITYK